MLKYSICQRNRAAGSRVWYIRTFDTVTKKISFESLGTEKKGEAVEMLARRNAERFRTPEETRAAQMPTIAAAGREWLEMVSRGNNGTFINYRNKIPALLDYCEKRGVFKISEFTTAHAAGLVESFPKVQKPSTIATKKRVYSTFFNWAFTKYGVEKINPFQRVKTPKMTSKEKEFWTPVQIAQILDHSEDGSERLLFAFMAYAGLRFSEAAGLCWENIEGGKISIVGKGSKFARVPIGERLRRELERFLDGAERPANGRIFRKYSNRRENTRIKSICDGLGMTGEAHAHKFRHSFISNLLKAGGSIVAVSKLARHEKPDITLRFYAHCLPDDLETTLNLL